jgi:hypothetical protein
VTVRGYSLTLTALTPVNEATKCSTLFSPTVVDGHPYDGRQYDGGVVTIKWKTKGGRIFPTVATFDHYVFFAHADNTLTPGATQFVFPDSGNIDEVPSRVVSGSFPGNNFALSVLGDKLEAEALADCNSRGGLKKMKATVLDGTQMQVHDQLFGP